MPRERRRKRLKFALLYPLYLLSWLVAVHYFVFWRPFVAEMRHRQVPPSPNLPCVPHIDALTAQRLGLVQTSRKSSFVNFSEAKALGTVRVCCLGDSFTYGSEAADGYDYPALLQAQFRGHGFDRVEVINFGSGWHGFHQSYVMWEGVGRHFDCDYVLLGPQSFQYNRDTTLNHSKLASPYYLHAHYVLDGNDVRLIEVPGDSYEQRFAEYFRFVPHWEYVRYDRNLPPTIQAILPANTTLPNVFHYFSGTMEEEGLATDKVLLRKLNDSAPQSVLLHDTPALLAVARSVGRANLVVVESYATYHFPYREGDGHYSPFGNQLVAEQFFAQLVHEADDRLSILESTDPAPSGVPSSAEAREPLSFFETIEVRFEEHTLGLPVTSPSGWTIVATGSPSALKDGAITSLLTVKDPGDNWIDANYISLDFPLRADMEVVLRLINGTAQRDIRLGSVRLLDPRLNIGVVDLRGVWPTERDGFTFPGNQTLAVRDLGPKGTRCQMLVDGRPVLHGSVDVKLKLTPVRGDFVTFRVGESGFIDRSALPDSGRFDLVLEHPRSGTLRVPLAIWRKTTVPMPRAEHPLLKRLARAEPDDRETNAPSNQRRHAIDDTRVGR